MNLKKIYWNVIYYGLIIVFLVRAVIDLISDERGHIVMVSILTISVLYMAKQTNEFKQKIAD